MPASGPSRHPPTTGAAHAATPLLQAWPDVIHHNVETVERLHAMVRPSARCARSLELLQRVKQSGAGIRTRSGIMLGLGETDEEVERTLADLRVHGCELLTIGQYLRPTPDHLPVVECVHPRRIAFGKTRADALASRRPRAFRW